MALGSYGTKPTPHEQQIIDNADRYSVFLFNGRSGREKEYCATIPEARARGRELARRYHKPALIYACWGVAACYLETVEG